MPKYLISTWSDPFKPQTIGDVFRGDLFCGNLGNLLFKHSVSRTLLCNNNELTYINTFNIHSKKHNEAYSHNDIDYINDNFDALILAEADLFNENYRYRFEYYNNFIKKIKIPTIMIGVGASTTLNYDLLKGSFIDSDIKKLVSSILDRSESIGLRGEFTKEYLIHLGFKESDLDVIGCPSMYTYGIPPKIVKDDITYKDFKNCLVSFNGDPYLGNMSLFINKHRNHIFVPQDYREFYTILFDDIDNKDENISYSYLHHKEIKSENVRFFVNIPQWINYMRKCNFSIGTRAHGNFVSLLAGTPAFMLAIDSRTEEFARFYKLPYGIAKNEKRSLYHIYKDSNYDIYNSHIGEKFDNYINFLNKNKLYHRYLDNNNNDIIDLSYDLNLFPEYIKPITKCDNNEFQERISLFKETISPNNIHPINTYLKINNNIKIKIMNSFSKIKAEFDNCKPNIIISKSGFSEYSSPYISYRKNIRNKIFYESSSSSLSPDHLLKKILSYRPKFPLSACFNIHNYCNLRCIMCPYKDYIKYEKNKTMNTNDFNVLLKDFYLSGGRIFTFNNFSDIFANEISFEYIDIAAEYYDKMQMYIVTNGVGMDKNKTNRLLKTGFNGKMYISLHAFNSKTYQYVTGRDQFSRVLQNIIYILENHPNPEFITIQMSTDFITKDEMNKAKKFFNKYNCYLNLFSTHTFAGNVAHKETTKKNILAGCNGFDDIDPGLFYQIVIQHDGEVTLCCMDLLGKIKLGNALRNGIVNIWNSNKFIKIIGMVYAGFPSSSNFICRHCTSAIEK